MKMELSDPPTEEEVSRINLAYLPRFTVPNMDEYLARSAQRSADVRAALRCSLDVPYGASPRERLDIFPADKPGAPVHVFIHGGYWRALDKSVYSLVAGPLVAAGATAVILEYDLCPSVRLTDIVAQARRALAWIHGHIAAHHGDPARIFVSGHSAGGHLTGMLAATDWSRDWGLPNDLIKATAPLSGLFDVEPHRHSLLQADLRLTAEEARQVSPMYHPPVARGPALVAVGEAESDLFHWQSLQYAAHLRLHGVKAQYVSVPGANHFDMTEHLADPRHPLTRALIAQMGL
ncbi:alpha/beta hydrolase [Ramlibacter sp. AW1]|uniref:Alpha/beta hydrolase n=1 Tax=Ramlibacter aurantiacus TaxID=2801330 RepID=A0A936ZYZ3_9BURK|nr:alpha/beta hydrolase [Ramlibacter aurantiacus]MBL0423044.1 alpha/beta hydrolase [Ramlibacter aurantiacus]